MAKSVSCFPHFLCTNFSSTLLVSVALFCGSPSFLSAFPPAPSIVLRSAAVCSERCTLFHHINSTSPLKDWPHTKLLFKGKKKCTRRRGWRGVAGWVCTCTRTSSYEHGNTGNDPPHPVMKPVPVCKSFPLRQHSLLLLLLCIHLQPKKKKKYICMAAPGMTTYTMNPLHCICMFRHRIYIPSSSTSS